MERIRKVNVDSSFERFRSKQKQRKWGHDLKRTVLVDFNEFKRKWEERK
jgi:hypothetical protein